MVDKKKKVVEKDTVNKKEEVVKKDDVVKENKEDKKDVAKKNEVIKFGFHNKLKKMYLTPMAFFKSEGETSYQSLLRTFVLFYVFYLVVMQVIFLFYGEFNIWASISSMVGGIVFAVIAAFILPGVIHVVSILFGVKGSFFNTYKAGIYTLVLWTFYSIILLIVSLILPFDSQGLQLALSGIADSSEIPSLVIDFLKANPGSLVSLLISTIIHLHILVFGIKALSVFQKISRGKSALVMVVSVVVIFFVQVGIISYLISRSQGLTP